MNAALRDTSALDRQLAFVAKADAAGKVLHRGEVDTATRRMGITLVEVSEDEKEGIVEEEVFGPVLAIIGVDVCQFAYVVRQTDTEGYRLGHTICQLQTSSTVTVCRFRQAFCVE
jgi:acyl-CoA reductase-like NAD-dependent aldehyde dehydrogenase